MKIALIAHRKLTVKATRASITGKVPPHVVVSILALSALQTAVRVVVELRVQVLEHR